MRSGTNRRASDGESSRCLIKGLRQSDKLCQSKATVQNDTLIWSWTTTYPNPGLVNIPWKYAFAWFQVCRLPVDPKVFMLIEFNFTLAHRHTNTSKSSTLYALLTYLIRSVFKSTHSYNVPGSKRAILETRYTSVSIRPWSRRIITDLRLISKTSHWNPEDGPCRIISFNHNLSKNRR